MHKWALWIRLLVLRFPLNVDKRDLLCKGWRRLRRWCWTGHHGSCQACGELRLGWQRSRHLSTSPSAVIKIRSTVSALTYRGQMVKWNWKIGVIKCEEQNFRNLVVSTILSVIHLDSFWYCGDCYTKVLFLSFVIVIQKKFTTCRYLYP